MQQWLRGTNVNHAGTAVAHSSENTTVAEGNGCRSYTQDQQAGEVPSNKVSAKTAANRNLLSITRHQG